MVTVIKLNHKLRWIACSGSEENQTRCNVQCELCNNAYVLLDKRTVLIGVPSGYASEGILRTLDEILEGRLLDYVIVQRFGSECVASLEKLKERHPKAQVVLSSKDPCSIARLQERLGHDTVFIKVDDNALLSIGERNLHFITAPMTHSSEALLSYVRRDGILFSGDFFSCNKSHGRGFRLEEASGFRRRSSDYREYFDTVIDAHCVNAGAALNYIAALAPRLICPTHGYLVEEDAGEMIEAYIAWHKECCVR